MNNGNPVDITIVGSSSFKYESSLLKNLDSGNIAANVNPDIANAHRLFNNGKIVVPLKYQKNLFRSLEMPLINCKIHLELNWRNNCVMSTIANTTLKITSTKFYVPFVTSSTKDK